ncbi:MAG: hypothetical protein M3O70_19955 [Actinomycetota bacterium]|nr:hypothetical protein [Actinomycetota bacterium]
MTVHTGSGRNRRGHLYWGQRNYEWNNTGDIARLRTPRGRLMDTCRYSGAGSSVNCLRRRR